MLLTRTPLYSGLPLFAFDLHVLGTPPALILSQDQTLRVKSRVIRVSNDLFYFWSLKTKTLKVST